MKKAIIGISAAVIWLICVILFAVAAKSGSGAEHQFTVLTVKEDAVKDYNTMPVFKQLAEDTGIEVHWIYNTSTQYSNNTDPVGIKGIDAIYHSGFSNLKLYDYGRRGRIVAIDDYLRVMPNFSKILKERPDIQEALKSPDGHIYSLPRVEEMGLKAYPNMLYLNKKWVEKLINDSDKELPAGVSLTAADLVDGLDLSRNQFKAILQKFNEYDMDGDGSTNNEVPLAFVSGNWQGNESDLIASFGVPENREHKTIVDGKITFTVEDEKWFTAVCELADWNQKGLIRSSSFTQTDSDFLARGQDGRYGSFYWWEKDTVLDKTKRDDYIIVLPLKDDDGNRYVGVSNELEVEKGACVVLDACEDKEGLLSYFDKFFEPDYSAQLNYGSIQSGAFLSQKVNGKLIPNDNHGEQSADDFRMKNAPYGVVYLTKEVWENNVQMETRASLRLENIDKYVKPYTFKVADSFATSIPNLNYTQEELISLNTYESSLSNNIASWFATSITGGATPTRESWQNLLTTNKNSLDTVKSINQAAYDRYVAATQGN
ncbi:MAG: hypothetical protein K2L12_07955 [Clostridia bacterium]|nr:hypothetical protein [Clostridia bacterium]